MTTDVKHPARYTDSHLNSIDLHLRNAKAVTVIDPFAGTGRIHELRPRLWTVGIEIEPEWATMRQETLVGSALSLPFPDAVFDAASTSPCFGNRMADHHNATDSSRRITYRHCLQRPLHSDNAGQLQWGQAYRMFHWKAWSEVTRVVRPGGRFVLNVKNHIRRGQEVRVTDWHCAVLAALGWRRTEEEIIRTDGMRFGANRELRSVHEWLVVFDKPRRPGHPWSGCPEMAPVACRDSVRG